MDMKIFKDFLFVVENQLGIRLLTWQKDILQKIYENKDKQIYFKPARGIGVTTLEKATLLLFKFKEENKL